MNGSASEWQDVLSGVPQGSVLGPLLFIIFIDDIDDSAGSIDILIKFADDTKTGHKVSDLQHQNELQDCINNMFQWSQDWSMKFNVGKVQNYPFWPE